MFKIIDQGILSRQPGRGAFMPVITSLSDGALIAAQHVGSSLGTPDCRIEVLRTSDGGRSWTNESDVPCGVPDDGWSYRGPEISAVANGRLLMTATRFECSEGKLFDPETEALQRPELLALWSPDQGRTWSDPQVVTDLTATFGAMRSRDLSSKYPGKTAEEIVLLELKS